MTINTTEKPWRSYAIIGGIAALFLILGLVGGYKWKERKLDQAPPESSAKLDSLKEVTRLLEDSIAVLNSQGEEAERVVVKWRTVYDTIQVTPPTDLTALVKGLNEIANTPIQ